MDTCKSDFLHKATKYNDGGKPGKFNSPIHLRSFRAIAVIQNFVIQIGQRPLEPIRGLSVPVL